MEVDSYTPPSQEPPVAGNDSLLVVHEPRVVVGDRGAAWLLLSLVGCLCFIVINFIPLVSILNGMLQPVWLAGLLLAVHAQRNGEPVKVSHLFAGFGPKAGRLVLSNVVVALVSLVAIGIAMGALFIDLLQAPDPQGFLLEQDMNSMLMPMLAVAALLVPVYAAAWFAPALIVFGNMGVQQALLLSLKACFRNWWPFLIYGLCLLVLGVLVVFTFGLALFVVAPMLAASVYLSFRDIFID